MKKILIFCAIVFASHAIAKSTVDLIEEALLHDQKTNFESTSDYGVNLLINEGVLEKKEFSNIDYSSFYLPVKPISFLDSELLAYEREYITKYIGCCVNPGNALILLPNKNISKIKVFAEKNKCGIEDQLDLEEKLNSFLIKKIGEANFKQLIRLSCKNNQFNDASGLMEN